MWENESALKEKREHTKVYKEFSALISVSSSLTVFVIVMSLSKGHFELPNIWWLLRKMKKELTST